MKTTLLSQHVQDALSQVRQIQQVVLERFRFRGFSGPTRMVSGSLALVTALAMSLPMYPRTTEAHLIGWFSVLGIALFINLGALIYWFATHEQAGRNWRKLGPVMDVLPPLGVGALFTVALVLHGLHDYLFGIWMCMFGLTNLASRYVLPRSIIGVGFFYILCGALWLFTPGASFLNPLIMGLVFFAGEWVGGMILHVDGRRLDETYAWNTEEKEHEIESL